MLQTVISYITQNVLKAGGVWMVTHGLATNDQWTAFAGMVAGLIGFVWNWHEKQAAAVAAGKIVAPVVPAAPVAPVASIAAKVALLMFIPALFLAGCSTTAQTTAYRTAGTTVVSVDAAMTEWGAYVAANHPTASQEQAVKTAFEHYQTAMAAVCDAGAVYAGAGQTNTTAAAGALQTAVGNVSNEIADLENLITGFGVQLHP